MLVTFALCIFLFRYKIFLETATIVNQSDDYVSNFDLEITNALKDEYIEDVEDEYIGETTSAKISVTGDLMVHQWQMDNAYNKNTNFYEFDYAFSNIKHILQNADLTIGNLETVLGGSKIGYSDYPMFNSPDSFAVALKNAGFDLLTTANNHSNDKREYGLIRTLDVLNYLKLDHVGTYKNQEDRDNIFIKDVNGIKLAFLSYTYGTNGIPLTNGKPYLCNILDETLIKNDIQKAKSLNPDFIIVMPHMGNEYELAPRDIFKNWTNIMFEAGADIVLASHPHVLQPAEFKTYKYADGTIRNCFVIYSLGNFISSQRTLPRDTGVIFNLYLEKEPSKKAIIKKISFTPTWVKFVNSKGNYDITVLPVAETLGRIMSGENLNLRQNDIYRLIDVSNFVSNIYLNKNTPLEQLKNEYFIYE